MYHRRMHRASTIGSRDEPRVVELVLVGHDVRVRVRRHREVPLADDLADPSPRHAAQVFEGDPSVPQVVR